MDRPDENTPIVNGFKNFSGLIRNLKSFFYVLQIPNMSWVVYFFKEENDRQNNLLYKTEFVLSREAFFIHFEKHVQKFENIIYFHRFNFRSPTFVHGSSYRKPSFSVPWGISGLNIAGSH